MNVLALDVGTSSVKAAVLEQATGVPLREPPASARLSLLRPEPDAAALSPAALWQAVVQAGRAAAAGQAVDAIGLSVFSPGWLLLDERHEPLTPIVTHLDRRARPAARELRGRCGEAFLTLNGNPILPGGISGVVVRHLLVRQPELRKAVRHFWHLNTWLGWRLAGEPWFDPGNAAFTGLCAAMHGFAWSPALAELLGLPLEWLPPIRDGRTTLGGLTSAAAADLGLPAGLPVKLGVPDTSSAALAARLQPGELLHVVGTTQVLALSTETPKPAPDRLTRPLGVGASFLQVAHNPVGGVALDWLRGLCFSEQSEAAFFGATIQAALARPLGSAQLDPPFLGGDRLEVEPQSASFRGLGLETDRFDLLAALLDAMRAGHRRALAALGEEGQPKRIVVTGGGAEVVMKLLPELAAHGAEFLPQASLRGVARLFD